MVPCNKRLVRLANISSSCKLTFGDEDILGVDRGDTPTTHVHSFRRNLRIGIWNTWLPYLQVNVCYLWRTPQSEPSVLTVTLHYSYSDLLANATGRFGATGRSPLLWPRNSCSRCQWRHSHPLNNMRPISIARHRRHLWCQCEFVSLTSRRILRTSNTGADRQQGTWSTAQCRYRASTRVIFSSLRQLRWRCQG